MKNRSCRIVVAEDDEDDRMILEAGLEAIGCGEECGFFNSGEELLGYLERKGSYTEASQLPDYVILDLNEPHSLLDTLRKLKSNPAFNPIRVVVLTSSAQKADSESLDLGVDAVVGKPIGFDLYVEGLRSAPGPVCKEALR